MTAAIDVRSVVKRYGSFEALRGVSLSIAQGEFFGLLGPNGAGKTTLLRLVVGLQHPSRERRPEQPPQQHDRDRERIHLPERTHPRFALQRRHEPNDAAGDDQSE